MSLDLSALPRDVDALQALVQELASALTAEKLQVEQLKARIAQLRRMQFGRSSEKIDLEIAQLELALDEHHENEGAREEAEPKAPRRVGGKHERRPSFDHLPHEEMTLDIGTKLCPCCGGALHAIGESVSEMLDIVPARLRVLRIRRAKYGCRSCGTIHQAPAPERPIAKGLATPGLLAHVLISKYCDHLPLYRQSQIFARQGVEIERSTLANWVGGACWWLKPLHERLAAHVFTSAKLFADDTTLPVLDPGRGRTKTGRLWVYARDDRPWAGTDPPAAVYLYSPDRKSDRPASHLKDFRGILQVDGYAGFERLTADGSIALAACWAHARRKFFDVSEATGSPIAAEALRRIAEIYAVERSINGQEPETRFSVRTVQSKPLVDALLPWLQQQLGRIPGSSTLAEAIRYTLGRWDELRFFLRDGRIELDNNTVERAIRPVALGRKNHMFAGSDRGAERWACVSSLVTTAKLNDVDPHAYLKDVLERMVEGHPMTRLDDLLPWNWAKNASTAIPVQ